MAGKDTKAALLLALAPKGKSEGAESETESKGGDDDAKDLEAAMAEGDGAALKAVIRRIAIACMNEEGDEGEY